MTNKYNLFLVLFCIVPFLEIHSSKKNFESTTKNKKNNKNIVSDQYLFLTDLPNELLSMILGYCDKKTLLRANSCSQSFYTLSERKKINIYCLVPRYLVKKRLEKVLSSADENKRTFLSPDFLSLSTGVKNYLKKKPLPKAVRKVIKKNKYPNKGIYCNQNIYIYYSILYMMQYYLLHNPYLAYIEANEDYWEPGQKPRVLIGLEECVASLKEKFKFPYKFKIDEDTYFINISTLDKPGYYCCKLDYGKNQERKTNVMYYSYLLADEKQRTYEIPFKFPYSVEDCVIIVNKSNHRNPENKLYARKEVKGLFKKFSQRDLESLSVITSGVRDRNKPKKYKEGFPFYLCRSKYPNLEHIAVKGDALVIVQPGFGKLHIDTSDEEKNIRKEELKNS